MTQKNHIKNPMFFVFIALFIGYTKKCHRALVTSDRETNRQARLLDFTWERKRRPNLFGLVVFIWVFPIIVVFPPKMDGLFHGKPY